MKTCDWGIPSLLSSEYSSRKVKRPRCETDRSPPYSAEVKNSWSCTTIPHTFSNNKNKNDNNKKPFVNFKYYYDDCDQVEAVRRITLK
jgi:hypothetical protein